MTFKTTPGNLLETTEGIIVHGCNCIGGFGSGIAGQIRAKWPTVAQEYEHWFETNPGRDRRLGDVQVLIGTAIKARIEASSEETQRKLASYIDGVLPELPPHLILVNGFTQFLYGGKSKADILYADYDAISAVFARLAALSKATKLPVFFPQIGAGLANGDWTEISRRIAFALDGVDSTYVEYRP